MATDFEIPANMRAFIRALRAKGYEVTVRVSDLGDEPSQLVKLSRTCLASASADPWDLRREENPPPGRPPARVH
jgi:hypothetical protein